MLYPTTDAVIFQKECTKKEKLKPQILSFMDHKYVLSAAVKVYGYGIFIF
jgi:hypothetical protein